MFLYKLQLSKFEEINFMSTATIRKKLQQYIETADKKKLKAIFAMVKDEIEETSAFWNDASFVNELKQRERSHLIGSVKAISQKTSAVRIKNVLNKVNGK